MAFKLTYPSIRGHEEQEWLFTGGNCSTGKGNARRLTFTRALHEEPLTLGLRNARLFKFAILQLDPRKGYSWTAQTGPHPGHIPHTDTCGIYGWEKKNGSVPVLVQRLCRAHEELLRGLEGDACVQGKLQVSRRKILEKSENSNNKITVRQALARSLSI